MTEADSTHVARAIQSSRASVATVATVVTVIMIPSTFLAMPRWWHEGQNWLTQLPLLVESQCRAWRLKIAGEPWHGSNALVVPVRRGAEELALRLTPPGDNVGSEVAALRFWNGRGTVRLLDADVPAGATLLERLDGARSLEDIPLTTAVPVIARMMRRLAVPGPSGVPSTAQIVASRAEELEQQWHHHAQPFSEKTLTAAVSCAGELRSTDSDLAVNGDLHFGQVLAGGSEEWLTIDPVLYRGDIEYDLARILWSRLDEMDDRAVQVHFDTIVSEAGLDEARAVRWVIFRSVDYWLWGLERGLTEDPARCDRLVRLFLPLHHQMT